METIAQILKEQLGKNIIFLAHHNADPDAVASTFVLSEFFKSSGSKTRICSIESISELSQNVAKVLGFEVEINPKLDADVLILLDTATSGQLSSLAPDFSDSRALKIIIDHHKSEGSDLNASYKFIDENATSTSEIIYKILESLGADITKKMALALLLGITAETAHLRHATLETFKLITKLMEEHSIKFQEVLEILTIQSDISERIANLKAAQRIKYIKINNFLVATSNVRSFEASAARALIKLGADISAVYAKRDDEIRVSIRARQNFLDKTGIDLGRDIISGVAKLINGTGSGHAGAAGANGRDINSGEKALEYIVNFIRKKLTAGS